MSRSFAGIDPDTCRAVFSQFATGVAVATVREADGRLHGLTVSSFTAVSIVPPLILFCIDLGCTIVDIFRTGTYFAINVLSDSQRELSVTFAANPEGRFEGIDWRAGETGAPILANSLAEMECTLDRVVEAGDHAVVFGQVVRAKAHPGHPLLYFNRTYRTLL